MTQGRANREVMRPKMEPNARAISVRAVVDIGLAVIRADGPSPMYKSQGFMAPPVKSSSSNSGSQGKY